MQTDGGFNRRDPYVIFNNSIVKRFNEKFHRSVDLMPIIEEVDKRLHLMFMYTALQVGNNGEDYVEAFFTKDILPVSEVLREFGAISREDRLKFLRPTPSIHRQLAELIDDGADLLYAYGFSFRKNLRDIEYDDLKNIVDEFEQKVYSSLKFELDEETGLPLIFKSNDIKTDWHNHISKHHISTAGLYVFFDVIKRIRRIIREQDLETRLDLYFAEFIRCEYITDRLKFENPSLSFEILNMFSPIGNYFDLVVAPYLALDLVENQNFRRFDLPDSAKLALRTFKQQARASGLIELPEVASTKPDESQTANDDNADTDSFESYEPYSTDFNTDFDFDDDDDDDDHDFDRLFNDSGTDDVDESEYNSSHNDLKNRTFSSDPSEGWDNDDEHDDFFDNDDDETASTVMFSFPYLEGYDGDKPIYVNVYPDRFLIGRQRGSVDYAILDNNGISRIHAEIFTTDKICYIKDKGSINGTFINGRRLNPGEDVELVDNDIVKFATCEFVFKYK